MNQPTTPTPRELDQARLQMLLAEAERLVQEGRLTHALRNELNAVTFSVQLHARGHDVLLTDVEDCVQRMRIAVKTGRFPAELLRVANEDVRRRDILGPSGNHRQPCA